VRPIPSLYLVTDRRQTHGRSLLDVVHAALDGGVDAVQLREKDLGGAALLALAEELRGLTARYDATLLVNDRVDVALAAGADGVHLGQAGMPPGIARRLVGAERLVAVSTHSLAEAVEAETAGANFVVFGPVYPTASKAAYGPPCGVEEVRAVAAAVRIPVLAIGGITVARTPEVRAAGAAGVAVVSAIVGAGDPETAARSLAAELGRASV
jgi:thiamine-phosphate pyrophosphorylase